MFWKVESYLDDAVDPNLEDAAGDGLGKSSETTLQTGAFEWWRQCEMCEHRQQWSSTSGWLKIEAVVFLTCLFCPFLRWSQMVLTLEKWCKVVLMTAVGAHCVRTGTVGGAEQRCGQGQRKGKGDAGDRSRCGRGRRHLSRGGDAGPA